MLNYPLASLDTTWLLQLMPYWKSVQRFGTCNKLTVPPFCIRYFVQRTHKISKHFHYYPQTDQLLGNLTIMFQLQRLHRVEWDKKIIIRWSWRVTGSGFGRRQSWPISETYPVGHVPQLGLLFRPSISAFAGPKPMKSQYTHKTFHVYVQSYFPSPSRSSNWLLSKRFPTRILYVILVCQIR
jgi:hypothetical protein